MTKVCITKLPKWTICQARSLSQTCPKTDEPLYMCDMPMKHNHYALPRRSRHKSPTSYDRLDTTQHQQHLADVAMQHKPLYIKAEAQTNQRALPLSAHKHGWSLLLQRAAICRYGAVSTQPKGFHSTYETRMN